LPAAKIILALGFAGATAQAVRAQAPAPSSSSKTSVLPAPTGSYGVGVVAHAVMDPRRREIFTLDTSDVRRFPVLVYYPAAKGACAPGPYFPPKLAEVYTAEFNLRPGFERTVRAHACPDAPIVSGSSRFPVILFSHGLGHTNFSYRSIIEDLVSHGNVVVAVDHTHGGRAVHFPDGEVVKRDNSRWFTGVDPERNMQAAKEYPRFWAEDARLVIDMLGSSSSPIQRQIKGRIDIERMIYAGHSFGGITAVYAAMIDPRIKGAVNLDGLIIGRYPLPVTTDAPLLVLNSKDRNELQTYMSAARVLPVGRSNHMTFSDFVWLHEQVGAGPPPPVDMSGEQGIALTRRAIRLFLPCVFERSCQGLDAQLAEIKGPIPPAPQQPRPSGAP
jgi:dienelactone hydrolase